MLNKKWLVPFFELISCSYEQFPMWVSRVRYFLYFISLTENARPVAWAAAGKWPDIEKIPFYARFARVRKNQQLHLKGELLSFTMVLLSVSDSCNENPKSAGKVRVKSSRAGVDRFCQSVFHHDCSQGSWMHDIRYSWRLILPKYTLRLKISIA